MSEPDTGGLGAKPEAHECGEGQVWDEAAGKCVVIDPPLPHIQDKPPELQGESLHTSMDLKGRIERVVKDYFDEMERRLSKMIDQKIGVIVKQKEADVEEQLRKSFGLDKDPVLHMSDLQKAVRKMQLDAAPGGKRSPASPATGVGPQGNVDLVKDQTPSSQITRLFKPYKAEEAS